MKNSWNLIETRSQGRADDVGLFGLAFENCAAVFRAVRLPKFGKELDRSDQTCAGSLTRPIVVLMRFHMIPNLPSRMQYQGRRARRVRETIYFWRDFTRPTESVAEL